MFIGDLYMCYRIYYWVMWLYGFCYGCIKIYVKMVFDKILWIEWVFDVCGMWWLFIFLNILMFFEIYVYLRICRFMFFKELFLFVFSGKLFFMNFGYWILRESIKFEFMIEKLYVFLEVIWVMNCLGEKFKWFFWVNIVSFLWWDDCVMVEWLENLFFLCVV